MLAIKSGSRESNNLILIYFTQFIQYMHYILWGF